MGGLCTNDFDVIANLARANSVAYRCDVNRGALSTFSDDEREPTVKMNDPYEHVRRNRARWDAIASDYVAAGERAWNRTTPCWGISSAQVKPSAQASASHLVTRCAQCATQLNRANLV